MDQEDLGGKKDRRTKNSLYRCHPNGKKNKDLLGTFFLSVQVRFIRGIQVQDLHKNWVSEPQLGT